MTNKIPLVTFLLFFFTLTAYSQAKSVRTGSHAFTIQWIDFNHAKPGTALIKSLGQGKYSIEGEQLDKSHGDYVTVKGIFEASGQTLLFDGKIVSRVSYINNGQPCERTGSAVFKASGKRKYWRLQQMLNCDHESTDYIDIYF